MWPRRQKIDIAYVIKLIPGFFVFLFLYSCASQTAPESESEDDAIDGDTDFNTENIVDSDEDENEHGECFEETCDKEMDDEPDLDSDEINIDDENDGDIEETGDNDIDFNNERNDQDWPTLDFELPDYSQFEHCVDLPDRYPGTWQLINPLPLPKANYGIWQNGPNTVAIGENGTTIWELDTNGDWKLTPKGINLVSGFNIEPLNFRDKLCILAGTAEGPSRCAVACIDSNSECWHCELYMDDILASSYGYGANVFDETILQFGSKDYIMSLSEDSEIKKEPVICSGWKECIVSRFLGDGLHATGRASTGYLTGGSHYILYRHTGDEWIEVQKRPEELWHLTVGIGKPLKFEEMVYLYTYAGEDEIPDNNIYALNLTSEHLDLISLPIGDRASFGGINWEGKGLLAQSDGYITILERGQQETIKAFRDDVYNFSYGSSVLWAAGSGYLSRYLEPDNWSEETRRMFHATSSDRTMLITSIAGPTKDHYYAIAKEQLSGVASQVYLVEVKSCDYRQLPLPLGYSRYSEPQLAYSSQEQALLVASDMKLYYLLSLDGGYDVYEPAIPADEHVAAVNTGTTHAFYTVLCKNEAPYACELAAIDYQNLKIISLLPSFSSAVQEISDGIVVTAHNEGLNVWDLHQDTLLEAPYPEGWNILDRANIGYPTDDYDKITISGFMGGFLLWSPKKQFTEVFDEDEEIYLNDVTWFNTKYYANGLRILDHSGNWRQYSKIASYRGNFRHGWNRTIDEEAANRLTVLEDRLLAFGTDEIILGTEGVDASLMPSCDTIEPTYPLANEICPGLCPEDVRSSTTQCQGGMCYIPGGTVCLSRCRDVTLTPYWIDETEVTNLEYALCVGDGACVAPKRTDLWNIAHYYGNPEYADYPVAYVNYENASRYCEYSGKRLPTEAEWQLAAMGYEHLSYPFQGQCALQPVSFAFDCEAIGMNHNGPVSVLELFEGRSPFGLYNMAGNMAEWVQDYYDPLYFSLSEDTMDPMGPVSGSRRVIRGANWTGGRINYAYSNARDSFSPETAAMIIGFRCAQTASVGP